MCLVASLGHKQIQERNILMIVYFFFVGWVGEGGGGGGVISEDVYQ